MGFLIFKTIIYCVLIVQIIPIVFGSVETSRAVCNARESPLFRRQPQACPSSILSMRNTIYLLYDVNPPEGFNLRRDVYVRLAVVVRNLKRRQDYKNVRLVLPPFHRLYHWKSYEIEQENLPWSMFFDIESLRRYAPVLDFPEFLEEYATFGMDPMNNVQIQRIFQLQQFDNMDRDMGVKTWRQFKITKCNKTKHFRGHFLQQAMLIDNEFRCLKFQGYAGILEGLLDQTLPQLRRDDVKVFGFLNGEMFLHNEWGGREFWRARRSMRFASHLVDIADNFRLRHFNSTNAYEKVQRPADWQMEQPYRGARGGAYLSVHLRRADFIHGRKHTTPSLKSAVNQIKNKLQELNLEQLFIATDATELEIKDLETYLYPIKPVRFTVESMHQKAQIKDGGIAIVDQLICAHSQHFIGSYVSTFTFRIHEEREIMGFPKNSTFNTLCKDARQKNCTKNPPAPITY